MPTSLSTGISRNVTSSFPECDPAKPGGEAELSEVWRRRDLSWLSLIRNGGETACTHFDGVQRSVYGRGTPLVMVMVVVVVVREVGGVRLVHDVNASHRVPG